MEKLPQGINKTTTPEMEVIRRAGQLSRELGRPGLVNTVSRDIFIMLEAGQQSVVREEISKIVAARKTTQKTTIFRRRPITIGSPRIQLK